MSFTTINLQNITVGNYAYLAFDNTNGFRLFAEIADSGVAFLHDISADPPVPSVRLLTNRASVDGSLVTDLNNSNAFDGFEELGQIIKIDEAWYNVNTHIDDNNVTVDRNLSIDSIVTFSGSAVQTQGINKFEVGHRVGFTTNGALPSQLTVDGIYYVTDAEGTSFSISATNGGSNIVFSGLSAGNVRAYRVHDIFTTTYLPNQLKDTILGVISNNGGTYVLEPFYSVNDSNVSPITILPALPAEGEYEGQVIINSSDNNIYTWNGVAWVTTTANTAKTVTAVASVQAFSYTSNGDTPDPATATITATAFGTEGTVYYEFIVDGATVQNSTANTYIYTPRALLEDMPDVIEVKIREISTISTVLASDIVSCFGVAPGSDAITILLTNEAHTLPSDSDGSNPDFNGSGTVIRVYRGNQLVPYSATLADDPSFKVSIFDEENVTAGDISGAGTTATVDDITAMTADRGYITFDVTVLSEGSETIYQKVQSFAKALAGIPGAGGSDAVTVQLTSDDYSIIYDNTDANPVPSSITLTAQSQNISVPYYTFRENSEVGSILQDSSTDPTYVVTAPSASFVPSKTYWVGVAATEDGTIIAYDTISVFSVRASLDGEDAYTVIVSNEAHTMPATSAGSVTSYDGSGTRIECYLGATELEYTSGTPGAGEFSISITDNDITAGSVSADVNAAVVADHSSMTADVATIVYTINLENLVTITKQQSFTKSKAGAAGSLGTGAAVVKLDVGTYVITYDADGTTPSPSGTLTLTATGQNIDDPWFKFTATPTIGGFDEATFTDGSGDTDTKGFTIPSTYFSTPYKFRVDVADGDQAGLAFDTISVYAVRPGIDAITAFLTNEAHTIPTAFDGTGASYTTAGGTFLVYDGITNVTTSATFAISGGTDGGASWTKVQNGLTFTINETTGVYSLSGGSWTSDSESFTVTATYGGVTLSKTYTVSKSKAGTPATMYYVTADYDAIKRNADNTLSPAVITFSAFSVAGNNAPAAYSGRFRVYRNGVLVYSSASNEATYAYTPATPSSLTEVKVELYAAGGFTTLLDSESHPVLVDGSNAVTVSIDNENVTFPAPASGFGGIAFGSATSTVRVYIGTLLLNYAGSGANTFSCTQSSTSATVASGVGSGTTFVLPVPTAMSATTAYTDITVTVRNAAAQTSTYTVRVTYGLARAGNDTTMYWLVSSADVIKRSTAHALTPSSITFTGYSALGTAVPSTYAGRFKVYRNGVLVYTSSGNEISYVYTPTSSVGNPLTEVKAEMFLAGGTTTEVDEETIPVVIDGSDAFTVSVDNDNNTFVGPPTGYAGITFGSATSTIRVFRGSTQLNYNTSGANTFSCVQSATGVTVATGSVGGGNSFIIPVPTAMATDTAYVDVTVTIRDPAAVVTTQTVRITYSLARRGAQGTGGTPGSQGTGGTTGIGSRIAYKAGVSNFAFSGTAVVVVSGDTLPTSGSWGLAGAWSTAPVTLTTGQTLYQVTGSYNPATNQTTWQGYPYLSSLKVGQLSAISADLGSITAGSLDIASKFIVASDGTVTIRNATTGQRLVITNSLLAVYDSSNVLRVRLGIW